MLCATAQDAHAASRVVKTEGCPSAGSRAVSFDEAIDGITFRTTEGSEVRLAGAIAPGGASSGESDLAEAVRVPRRDGTQGPVLERHHVQPVEARVLDLEHGAEMVVVAEVGPQERVPAHPIDLRPRH